MILEKAGITVTLVGSFYEDSGEPYKVDLVDRIPEGAELRMYWHGDWQDLCRGPHLQHTGQLPADSFKLMGVHERFGLSVQCSERGALFSLCWHLCES